MWMVEVWWMFDGWEVMGRHTSSQKYAWSAKTKQIIRGTEGQTLLDFVRPQTFPVES
jgi:hypothetical protein